MKRQIKLVNEFKEIKDEEVKEMEEKISALEEEIKQLDETYVMLFNLNKELREKLKIPLDRNLEEVFDDKDEKL
jgi:aromatic ring-opening dioxygenase LigB subunit